MPFDKKPAIISWDGKSVYPGKLFDMYAVESVTANADFTDDDGKKRYWDYDVVQAEDYEKLLRAYEAIVEIAKRGGM